MIKPRILVPALAMLFLTACATTQSTTPSTATAGEPTLVDQYMQVVNSSAAANHAEVHWVNVPEEKDLARYSNKD